MPSLLCTTSFRFLLLFSPTWSNLQAPCGESRWRLAEKGPGSFPHSSSPQLFWLSSHFQLFPICPTRSHQNWSISQITDVNIMIWTESHSCDLFSRPLQFVWWGKRTRALLAQDTAVGGPRLHRAGASLQPGKTRVRQKSGCLTHSVIQSQLDSQCCPQSFSYPWLLFFSKSFPFSSSYLSNPGASDSASYLTCHTSSL